MSNQDFWLAASLKTTDMLIDRATTLYLLISGMQSEEKHSLTIFGRRDEKHGHYYVGYKIERKP